jgi:hypothetical protein
VASSKRGEPQQEREEPTPIFGKVSQTELSAAFIDPAALSYRGYRSFIRERRDAIVSRLSEITQITESDFAGLNEPDEDGAAC